MNEKNMDFDAILRELPIEREEIFKGKVLHVFRDQIALPNGKTSMREYALHRGAVAVVALDQDERVTLVRQYRYAAGRSTLEIPAGKLEIGEDDVLEAARRELSEEIGATAGKMTSLGVYLSSPAILSERIYCFLAEDLTFGTCHPDEDENLMPLTLPLSEAIGMVLDGTLEDGKTTFALQKAYLLKHPPKF